jgi:Resolvase, N terminal domain
MAQGRFVAYYRVSTDRQGRSGLGLEAQQEAVRSYLDGGSWQLVDEVVEVESGKRNDRPKLAEALKLCRLHGATLIIAKLDRLARNVAFVSNLMESGVEFVAVDFPQANRLTVHILAAVAEHEREMISHQGRSGRREGPWHEAGWGPGNLRTVGDMGRAITPCRAHQEGGRPHRRSLADHHRDPRLGSHVAREDRQGAERARYPHAARVRVAGRPSQARAGACRGVMRLDT